MIKLKNRILDFLFKKKTEPSMLAHYILWYNRNDNWFERLSANKQIELLFWNPDCYNNTSCVQSAGSPLQNEHIPTRHGKINGGETAGVV